MMDLLRKLPVSVLYGLVIVLTLSIGFVFTDHGGRLVALEASAAGTKSQQDAIMTAIQDLKQEVVAQRAVIAEQNKILLERAR